MASYDNTQEVLPKILRGAIPSIWYPSDVDTDNNEEPEVPGNDEEPVVEEPVVEPTA